MEIRVKRTDFTDESTIGELYINDKLSMYTLEDFDRGLKDEMPIEGIKALKVHSLTAIPTGRYQLVMSFSNRFQKYLPEILNVKGFAGIRMHTGNKAADSEGCILVGKTIRNSSIRELTNGLVVGVERNGKRLLNPESNLEFQHGDTVWMVAEEQKLQTFLKQNDLSV